MPDTSLLPAATQLPLIPSSDMPDEVFRDAEARGEYTGERLAARDPERYRAVISLLAEGLGIHTVARILHVTGHTVQGVRDREGSAITTLRAVLAGDARTVARLCAEHIRTALLDPDFRAATPSDIQRLSVVYGIMVERSELLSGGPTSRIAITGGEPRHEELVRYLRQLRADYDAQTTGLGGETETQKEIDVSGEIEVGEPLAEAAPAEGEPLAEAGGGQGATDETEDTHNL